MQRLSSFACHIISPRRILAILIIVILQVIVDVKEGGKQQIVKTFKIGNLYECSESHRETKNKRFFSIERMSASFLAGP